MPQRSPMTYLAEAAGACRSSLATIAYYTVRPHHALSAYNAWPTTRPHQ